MSRFIIIIFFIFGCNKTPNNLENINIPKNKKFIWLTGLDFDNAYPFYEGVGIVKRNNKYFYIDTMGNITPDLEKFTYIAKFQNGFARADINKPLGYIDQTGKIIIQTEQYAEIYDFSDSLARIRVREENKKTNEHESKYGYINTQGKIAIPPIYDYAQSFSHGVAWVKSMKSGLDWVILTKEGKTIIPEKKVLTPGHFYDSLAIVSIANEEVYMNKVGEVVIKLDDIKFEGSMPFFYKRKSFSEGLCPVLYHIYQGDTLNKYGYIDTQKNLSISPQFDKVRDFHESLAGVEVAGKWGFIDKKGKWAVGCQFDYVRDFSNGYATVRKKEKWGLINKEGRMVIEPQFDYIGKVVNNIVSVYLNGKFGYIKILQ